MRGKGRTVNKDWNHILIGQYFSIPELRHLYGLEKTKLIDSAIRAFIARMIQKGCVVKVIEEGKYEGEVFQMKYRKVSDTIPLKKKIPEPLLLDKTISAVDLGTLFIDSFIKIKEELKKSNEELKNIQNNLITLDKENDELKESLKKAERDKFECQKALDDFVVKYNGKSIQLKDVITVNS
jgi:cell shape-determining protein MreC